MSKINFSVAQLCFIELVKTDLQYPIRVLCLSIIKDLFFNEINLLTEDEHKNSGLYMISSIAQLKDN